MRGTARLCKPYSEQHRRGTYASARRVPWRWHEPRRQRPAKIDGCSRQNSAYRPGRIFENNTAAGMGFLPFGGGLYFPAFPAFCSSFAECFFNFFTNRAETPKKHCFFSLFCGIIFLYLRRTEVFFSCAPDF